MAAVGDRSTESAWYAFMGFDPDQHRRVRGFYRRFFTGCHHVLDLACGRGEFLDVLRQDGIGAVGLDHDAGMVELARKAGHQVEDADAFEYLAQHPVAFDGIFSAHFVEHLPPERVTELIGLASRALEPGGRLVLATPNSASLPTLQREFWWDPTHVRFYDVDLLRFWLTEAGFNEVEGGTNPESHPGSPIGLTELEVPRAGPLARAFYRLTGISKIRHHQMVLAGSLQGLIRELYRPNEVYVVGRKPDR
jgi:SAM-dependent methyltransferase